MAPAPKGLLLARAPSWQHQRPRSTAGQGRTGWDSRQGQSQTAPQDSTDLAPLLRDLLQQEQKLAGQVPLASLVSSNLSFLLFYQTSWVFLSKRRGLTSAPGLWRQQLACECWSSHTYKQGSPDTGGEAVSRAGSHAFWDKVSAPPASKAPGTFLPAPSSRQKQAVKGNLSMVHSSTESRNREPGSNLPWNLSTGGASPPSSQSQELQHRQEGLR